ncbi:MAG: PAS domain S-box protein, partial [Planctomycetes bacterium]|nr:PAS domain S-box protein [Planctomycetota bacterium]
MTASWNELIDLVQGLYDDVQRGSANDELLHVLKTGGGSALADGLNAVPEAVLFVQDSDTIRFANTAARRLFGWDADESVDLAISTASANGGGEKILESIRSALQASEGVLNSTDLVELDDPGAASAYRICIHPLKKGPYTGNCMIVIRDVSQQTRADRAREEFITQVTHELRTPLTNIRAYAETLS